MYFHRASVAALGVVSAAGNEPFFADCVHCFTLGAFDVPCTPAYKLVVSLLADDAMPVYRHAGCYSAAIAAPAPTGLKPCKQMRNSAVCSCFAANALDDKRVKGRDGEQPLHVADGVAMRQRDSLGHGAALASRAAMSALYAAAKVGSQAAEACAPS